mgnify:CR=1 FL=1
MNRIWYLSPSNQGANLGVGNYGSERDQMYRLVLEITPHLDRAGVSFVIPEKNVSLTERVRQSNEINACFHLALHSNAGGKGQARGPVAYYYSETGKVFAEKMVDALLALKPENNRSSNLGQNKTFYELRKTTAPACLLEVDFHDSQSGVAFLINRRSEIAEAIAKAIIEADGKTFDVKYDEYFKINGQTADTNYARYENDYVVGGRIERGADVMAFSFGGYSLTLDFGAGTRKES